MPEVRGQANLSVGQPSRWVKMGRVSRPKEETVCRERGLHFTTFPKRPLYLDTKIMVYHGRGSLQERFLNIHRQVPSSVRSMREL